MFLLDTDKAQAVLFFGNEGVSKELLFPELEALLEGFVPLEEWANTAQKAVYVEFNHQFLATAVVFFTMSFDAKGAVDSSWNLPLLDMARTTAKGPDLGAGPVRITCATHCPIAYFKDWLWDPDMNPDGVHFKQIQRSLKRNRLGVHFRSTRSTVEEGFSAQEAQRLEAHLSQHFSKQYEKALREQMSQLLEGQRLRIASMVSDRDEAIQAMRGEYESRIEELQRRVEEGEVARTDLDKRNQELRLTIDGQMQKIEGLREYYEHKLRRLQGSESETLETVRVRLETEMQNRMRSATNELSELLKMKEVELLYRTEHEEQLQQEILRLRREHQASMLNSGDQFLESLSRKGVNFVTYQPGAGHITIPYSEMSLFLENPPAFTAAYCGVTEKQYLEWLRHYQTPVCAALDENGEMCCANLSRVTNPTEFVAGESDLCDTHRRSQRAGKLKAI
ncbi:MAG: sodium:proton antiporter [Cellvibrionaceae bacterium]|nr:sodium:proton antiporter [Cellvibrionaceae bacterium]